MKSKSKERNKEQQELPKFFGSRDQGIFRGPGHVCMGGQGNGALANKVTETSVLMKALTARPAFASRPLLITAKAIAVLAISRVTVASVDKVMSAWAVKVTIDKVTVALANKVTEALVLMAALTDTVTAAFASRPLLITAKAIVVLAIYRVTVASVDKVISAWAVKVTVALTNKVPAALALMADTVPAAFASRPLLITAKAIAA